MSGNNGSPVIRKKADKPLRWQDCYGGEFLVRVINLGYIYETEDVQPLLDQAKEYIASHHDVESFRIRVNGREYEAVCLPDGKRFWSRIYTLFFRETVW